MSEKIKSNFRGKAVGIYDERRPPKVAISFNKDEFDFVNEQVMADRISFGAAVRRLVRMGMERQGGATPPKPSSEPTP